LVSCAGPSPGNDTLKRRQEDSIILGDTKGSWEESLKRNTKCAANNKDSEMKYVGTSAVVQDMMHFVELQAALRGQDPASAHINYFGTSYGTGVGQTLVALYPERVRRALLDGNIYAVAHYQGWEPNGVDDFAHGVWLFSKLCFEAGPEWCPLAEGMDSIDEVQARFDAVVLALGVSPIVCSEEAPPFDDNQWLGSVSQMMYQARRDFVKIANQTLEIEAALSTGDNSVVCAGSSTASKIRKREDAPEPGDDHVTIISAVDQAGRYPWRTYEEWKAAAEQLETTAPYGAWTYATGNG
jgi:pimeloyl-ACP methyl ester carboxylesterase